MTLLNGFIISIRTSSHDTIIQIGELIMSLLLGFVSGLLVGAGVVLHVARKTFTDDLTSTERKVMFGLLKRKGKKIFTKYK